jgi:Tfp pilus assembly protein PilF
VGVTDVAEDASSRVTVNVVSSISFTTKMKPGKKMRFTEKYQLGGFKQAENMPLIIRIESALGGEATEYSLRKLSSPNPHWKVLL